MSKVIWKYELEVADQQEIEMPCIAEPLSAARQGRNICVWALVDPLPELSKKRITVFVRGTGHPMGNAEGGKFLGTILFQDGDLVFHVFYKDGVDFY